MGGYERELDGGALKPEEGPRAMCGHAVCEGRRRCEGDVWRDFASAVEDVVIMPTVSADARLGAQARAQDLSNETLVEAWSVLATEVERRDGEKPLRGDGTPSRGPGYVEGIAVGAATVKAAVLAFLTLAKRLPIANLGEAADLVVSVHDAVAGIDVDAVADFPWRERTAPVPPRANPLEPKPVGTQGSALARDDLVGSPSGEVLVQAGEAVWKSSRVCPTCGVSLYESERAEWCPDGHGGGVRTRVTCAQAGGPAWCRKSANHYAAHDPNPGVVESVKHTMRHGEYP